jgi:O-antigen/teichoic acid export membrane protein
MLSALVRSGSARLASHAALYGAAGAFSKAGALLAVPYLTRQLGPTEYGLADLATSFAALLVLFVRFAGDIPTMRRVAGQEPAQRSEIYSAFVATTAVLSVLAVLVLLPASEVIASGLWSAPASAVLATSALALVPINAVQAAVASILRFEQRPRAFAAVASLDLMAQLIFAVLLAAIGWGALGVILGYLSGGVVGLVVAAFVVRRNLTRRINWRTAASVLAEGLPFLPSVAAFYLADTVARMIAANTAGVDAVGHLALAIRIASVMGLASGAFSAAWGPVGLGMRQSAQTRTVFGRVLVTLSVLASTAALSLGALSPELSILFGGDGFKDAAPAIPGLLLSGGMAAVLYLLTTAAGIAERGRWVAWSATLGAGSQIIAVALLLPPFGIGGFALGSIIGRLVTIGLLGSAVADTMRSFKAALVMLTVASGAALLIQLANVDPAANLGLRLIVAGVSASLGAWWLFAAVGRQLTSAAGGDPRMSSDPR